MFGLGFLIIILLYVCISILISNCIKKGIVSLFLYWTLVLLIPIWFFSGHYIYPSYFKYQELCKSETVNNYFYETNINSTSDKEWLVPNRLVKWSYINSDPSGNVAHKLIYFSFYPYGSNAKIMGLASGTAPSMSCHGTSNLTDFIKKNINISPIKQPSIMQEAEIISESELNDSAFIKRGRSGDTVSCENKVVGKGYNGSPGLDVSYLIQGTKLDGKQNIEKTICMNDYIYIVKTPNWGNDIIQVYVFDYTGTNIRNMKFPTPKRSWKGYPRKPLIYFGLNDDAIIIGIEEFGEDIESENIYYKVKYGK